MNYELELAKALNDRDAYGVVVARLIEWELYTLVP